LRRAAAGFTTRIDTALLAGCILVALVLRAAAPPVKDAIAAFLRSTVLAPLFSMQSAAEKWRGALASYDALVASRDSAVLAALELSTVKAENERLAEMLMLGSRLRWGFIPARVLHQTAPGRPTTVTLSVGAENGVKVLQPVVAVEGLVGVVQSVDARTSVVSLWTNPDFAAGAMPEDASAFGIVSPYGASEGDGYYLVLNNVQYRHRLAPGTRIVASGHGGVHPRMTPIGTIVRELETESGLVRRYLVRPAVRPQDVASVMVLDSARAAAGVAGVWPTQAGLDSARRVMVAKGDSIARARGMQ
jgi:rod shape-determining protein MreC